MAAPASTSASYSSHMAGVVASMESAPSGDPAPNAGTPAPGGDPSQAPNGGQNAPVDPIAAFTGQQPQAPNAGAEPEPSPDTPKWNLQIDPTTVVAHDHEGKPITAAEVEKGYLRQSDYSRKTADIAGVKTKAEEYDAFLAENLPVLQDLDSGDPARIKRAIEAIAGPRNFNIAQHFGGATDTRQRGPDGKFQAAQGGVELVDVSQYDEGTEAHELATAFNKLASSMQSQGSVNPEVEALKQQVEQMQNLLNGVGTAVERNNTMGEMGSIAEAWAQTGFTEPDLEGAFALIGKPMDASMAMKMHHFEKIVRHLVGVARTNGQPANLGAAEPPSSGIQSGADPTKMGSLDFIRAKLGV